MGEDSCAYGDAAFGYRVQPAVFLAVVSGRLSPPRGFFDGNIALEGTPWRPCGPPRPWKNFFKAAPICYHRYASGVISGTSWIGTIF